TVKDGTGAIVCAPADTPPDDNCVPYPVCKCKGMNCDVPCAGVQCDAPSICANYGAKVGQCTENNCFNVPCVGCDQSCHYDADSDVELCLHNPCAPNPCGANEVCKPTPDFAGHVCQPSCANADCASGQVCIDGVCQATCSPACP